jgi:hypothetical protein
LNKKLKRLHQSRYLPPKKLKRLHRSHYLPSEKIETVTSFSLYKQENN